MGLLVSGICLLPIVVTLMLDIPPNWLGLSPMDGLDNHPIGSVNGCAVNERDNLSKSSLKRGFSARFSRHNFFTSTLLKKNDNKMFRHSSASNMNNVNTMEEFETKNYSNENQKKAGRILNKFLQQVSALSINQRKHPRTSSDGESEEGTGSVPQSVSQSSHLDCDVNMTTPSKGSTGRKCSTLPARLDYTPSVIGLRNHGNTCFINAILQCLNHTDLLAEYFVTNQYQTDLKRKNRLGVRKFGGTKGEITEQLAGLLKALWSSQYEPEMTYKLKSVIDKYGTQYRGAAQHDAQEFLLWLLDKVHEDLNTATKRKYKKVKVSCAVTDVSIVVVSIVPSNICHS